MTIFGSGIATGKYAMASSQPLGSPSDFADTTVKAEMFGETPPKATEGSTRSMGSQVRLLGRRGRGQTLLMCRLFC
jgi:hypothetical protein